MSDQDAPDDRWPPPHRRSFAIAVGLWFLLLACGIGWLQVRSATTRAELAAHIPSVSAKVGTVYLTPQIESAEGPPPDALFTAPAPEAVAPVAEKPKGEPVVALVITGLGLASTATTRAIEDMPPEVALAFSAYGNLAEGITSAKKAGHEALALLPMEPTGYPRLDPGPKTLLARATDEENAKMLDKLLRDAANADGAMNDMGSALLVNREKLLPLLRDMKRAGVLFVEQGGALAAAAAADTGLPYLSADINIDADGATESDVSQKLIDLERIAREKGHAIGVASPYPVTFNMVKVWLKGLESRGVRLVPLSGVREAVAR
jgi:uncharacterized protein